VKVSAGACLNLVLLPGMDGTGALFEGFISVLPKEFQVHVAKYPSDRFLPYSELAGLVEELIRRLDNVVLVAESFSAPLAINLAASRSSNLIALVICAGFASSPVGAWVCRFVPLLETVLRIPAAQFLFGCFLVGAKAPKSLRAALRKSVRSVPASVLAARLRAILECDVRQELLRVAVPILYVRAGKDRLVRKRCYREIKRLRPDTVLQTIRAPHLVLQTQPAKAAEAISSFLRRVTGPDLRSDQG
jgi:pimeloyl-ACP methyl ester carboxylesterase